MAQPFRLRDSGDLEASREIISNELGQLNHLVTSTAVLAG